MTRRKGEYTAHHKRRDFPHGVEIEIPPGGLGQRLNALHAWCGARVGPEYTTTGRLEGMKDHIQFRFRDPAVADEFRYAARALLQSVND